MEHLGNAFESPSKNRDGKWNSVDIFYKNDEEFNGATSKLIKMFQSPNGDGRCGITDNDSNKHMLDIVHVTFDTVSNSVRLFPYNCTTY